METISIKLKRSLLEGTRSLRYFGWRVTFAKLRCIWQNDSLESVAAKNRVVLQYLEKMARPLLDKYTGENQQQRDTTEATSAPIWVLWWQGREKMPDIIRLCLASKEASAGAHPIILLTKENIEQYVDFPDTIWEQFREGRIRIQHLADMIRVRLIRTYGGLWLDASIFCHDQIPERAFNSELFTLKGKKDPRFVSENRWTTFVIGGLKDNVLCSFLDDFFMMYCQTGKPFVDYFQFDCAIALAYFNIPAVNKQIDLLPQEKGDCYWLNEVLKWRADEELITKMQDEPSVIYKIGWSSLLEKPAEESLYAKLLTEFGLENTHEKG